MHTLKEGKEKKMFIMICRLQWIHKPAQNRLSKIQINSQPNITLNTDECIELVQDLLIIINYMSIIKLESNVDWTYILKWIWILCKIYNPIQNKFIKHNVMFVVAITPADIFAFCYIHTVIVGELCWSTSFEIHPASIM